MGQALSPVNAVLSQRIDRSHAPRFKGRDFRLVVQGVADFVYAFEQAMLGEAVYRKLRLAAARNGERLVGEVDLHRRLGVFRDSGVIVDTHTADGIKVGLEHGEPGVPLLCLETALPAKFAATVREALGRDPETPPGFEGLESKPQRVEVMDADAELVKAFITRRSEA